MLSISHCLRTLSDITHIQPTNKKFITLSTKHHGIKVLDYNTLKVDSHILNQQADTKINILAFSPDGRYYLYSVKNSLFTKDVISQKVINEINTQSQEIHNICIDSQFRYIVASTKCGRVLLFKTDSNSIFARIHSYKYTKISKQPHTTCTLFKNNILACGSTQGDIFIVNIQTLSHKKYIHNTHTHLNCLCFLNDDILISGNDRGDIYFNSIKTQELLATVQSCFTTIKQIILLSDSKYMLVNGGDNYIALYHTQTFNLLQKKYLTFDDSVKNILLVDENILIITLQNNYIEKIHLNNTMNLKSFILVNALDKAYELVEKDPALRGSKEYAVLEIAYKRIYDKALASLVKSNKTYALEITQMFKYTDLKKDQIQLLFKSFENYPRFIELYKENKYALAYAMSTIFPPLCQTPQYKKMEEEWEISFLNAQKQLTYNKTDIALNILKKYRTVLQKQPLINFIHKNNHLYLNFLEAIQSQNFQLAQSLVQKNKLLTQLPSYKKMQAILLKALEETQITINKGNLTLAIEQLTKLRKIESIKVQFTLLIKECRVLKLLQDAYEKNNFLQCYELIDENDLLQKTDLGILLQEHWSKILLKCEDYALLGQIKEIKQVLGELILIESRQERIGNTLRLAFRVKIKKLLTQKIYHKAELLIYAYIDIFAYDQEIDTLSKTYKENSKLNLAITYNARDARKDWRKSSFIQENSNFSSNQ